MSKKKLFLFVNCNRVFEGTLRNLLPPAFEVRSINRDEIDSCLFPQPSAAQKAADLVSLGTGTNMDAARSVVSVLLDKDASPATPPAIAPVQAVSPKTGRTISPAEPDCIVYQVSEAVNLDVQAVRTMRRKCRFRDVPIFLVAGHSDLIRANALISHGANEIIEMPGKPDAIVRRLTGALDPAGSRMPVLAKLINPYINATVDLLSTMAGLHAEKKEVFLKKNYRLFGDISAIMSLSGTVEGQVVVCFEEQLARDIVARIMSQNASDLTKDELREGIGEIVNIVSGNAKAALAKTEYAHQIGLPAVVFGQAHELSHPGNAPCIVVIFDVAGQPMAVLVSISIKAKPQ